MRGPIRLLWCGVAMVGCAGQSASMVKTAPPEDAGHAVMVRPAPPLTEPMLEPSASPGALAPAVDAPPACETLPRPPRARVATPPVVERPRSGPGTLSAVAEPLEVELKDYGGPNAPHDAASVAGFKCEVDPSRIRAALDEVDLRGCRVEGEPPCGTLRVSLDPSGIIFAAERVAAQPSRSERCVARRLVENGIRFDSGICRVPPALSWTYFVDR